MKFDPKEAEILIYWVRERDAVRQRRAAAQPKPWTSDPILRDNRWCNVRRMDDKVSGWLMGQWYPLMSLMDEDVLAAAALARLVNWPESLMGINRVALARGALRDRFGRGLKTFTGAYIVPGVPGRGKVDSVCDAAEAIGRVGYGQLIALTMEECWGRLRQFPGIGSFLAGQIVADVAELPEGSHWSDSRRWAPPGPGSTRGLNRLLGQPKALSITYGDFQEGLRAAATLLAERTEVFHERRLTAMDVQNCLCEFDKYRRLQLNEGQVRASYPGVPRFF